MPTIAFVNQKGGVGKTTVLLGVAEAATAVGKRVLVVDLDPQANASAGLGVWESSPTIDDVLATNQSSAALDAIVPSAWPDRPNKNAQPDLIPGDPRLAAREQQLATDPLGAQDRLQTALQQIAQKQTAPGQTTTGGTHDLVLIDSPPSLGLLCVNALFAADYALIVTEPAAWSADGVDLMKGTIEQIAQRRGGPELLGIVINRRGRTRDHTYWAGQLEQRFGDLLLPSVGLRAAVAEAAGQSLPLKALGGRPGAAKSAREFSALFAAISERLSSPPTGTPLTGTENSPSNPTMGHS